MLDERIKSAQQNGESSASQLLSGTTPATEEVKKRECGERSPIGSTGKNGKNYGSYGNAVGNQKLIKSPSDTTFYAPTLQRGVQQQLEVLNH